MKKTFMNYGNFGKCMELSANGTTIRITCDIGPRIIYLARENGINMM